LASFFNALQVNWKKREWNNSNQLIEEIMDLEILQDREYSHLKQILNNWFRYFSVHKDQKSLNEVKVFFDKL